MDKRVRAIKDLAELRLCQSGLLPQGTEALPEFDVDRIVLGTWATGSISHHGTLDSTQVFPILGHCDADPRGIPITSCAVSIRLGAAFH